MVFDCPFGQALPGKLKARVEAMKAQLAKRRAKEPGGTPGGGLGSSDTDTANALLAGGSITAAGAACRLSASDIKLIHENKDVRTPAHLSV